MLAPQMATIVSKLLINHTTCLIGAVSTRSYRHWPESQSKDHVFMPSRMEDRCLPSVPAVPLKYPEHVNWPYKYPRNDREMMGPEPIHNQLIYRQFGIMAIGGGAMKAAHFDLIKLKLDKFINYERFFAIWRVDPPWKPVSKRSQGKRRGGGKAKVHHYETPVKAGRVIVELAGLGEYGEVQRVLTSVSNIMPFYAMPVSQEILDNIKAEKMQIEATNFNPFDYRTLVKKNFSDSQRHVDGREIFWGGTYFQ